MFFLFNFIKRYSLLIGIASAFSFGWIICYKFQEVKYQKLLITQKNQIIQENNSALKIAHQTLELHVRAESELQNQLKQIQENSLIKDKEIENAKYKLERSNIITAQLVRLVQESDSTNSHLSPTSSTSSHYVSDDTTVSAFRYTKWGRGLVEHDNNCVLIHNATIKWYNKQKEIINK